MRSVKLALAVMVVMAGAGAAGAQSPPGGSPAAPPAAAAGSSSSPGASPPRGASPAGAQAAPRTPPTRAISPLLVFDAPALPPPSLRLEAARIAGQRADLDWRYPEPGPLFGTDQGLWFMGYGRYRPRTGRSAALHGGSMAATLVGQILLQADTPLAGLGALLTGATLDAAAADADRDAESQRPTQR